MVAGLEGCKVELWGELVGVEIVGVVEAVGVVGIGGKESTCR